MKKRKSEILQFRLTLEDKEVIEKGAAFRNLDVSDGYYTLCPCHVNRDLLPKKFGGCLPSEVPAIKLARLAVDKRFQGKGYGGILLAHSLKVAYRQSEFLGSYVILVDVKPSARNFYEKYGMKIIKDHAQELMMGIRTKDIPSYLPSTVCAATHRG